MFGNECWLGWGEQTMKSAVDPVNIIQREVNGCKVQLRFAAVRNEHAERTVLDNLMGVFEHKLQELSSV